MKKFFKNKKKLFIYIGIFICLCFGFFILYDLFIPKIKLNGKNVINVTYKKEYKEKGAVATFLGRKLSNKVNISGKVNSNKLGSYTINYTYNDFVFPISRKRIVNVVDNIKPKIKLNGETSVNVCPNFSYEEEGYTATDNYDGDLTKKVKVNKKKDKIEYKVTDSSDNTAVIARNINYVDKDGPVINLNGLTTFYVSAGTNFVDPGYSSIDACDGDLTDKVVVSGEVDTNTPNTYTLTYSVTDNSGNTSSVERSVVVSRRANTDGFSKPGVIYLTFDDGPNEGTTNVILDILKEEGVKATFFVTGFGPDYLIKRESDEGHTVALHTATHDYGTVYASVDAYFNDLTTVHDRVQRITGIDSRIIRFPGGSSNTVSRKYCSGIMSTLVDEVLNRGYRYYDWNVSSGDAGGTSEASGVYSNVINGLSKSKANMILMHDTKPHTRDALRDIIRYGKENNYSFEAITMDTAMVRHGVNN